MKPTKLLLTAILVFVLGFAQAQKNHNPWKKYGYTPPKALTLSNGKYQEFFDNDTIVQIGSVMFNTVTNKIVAFIKHDTVYSEAMQQPHIISRWLSPDPLSKEFANESPYLYAGNNPIYYIDIAGGFKIPVHYSITTAALAKAKIQITDASKLDILSGNTAVADIIGGFSDYHFDGRNDFSKIQKTWSNLKSEISNIDFGSMNKNLGGYDAINLGKKLHTVQDFYSHSNYIELYVEYYKSNNKGALPTEVPIYDEGIKIPGFKTLMERTTYDKDGKYQGLHTGEFNLVDNEFWDFNPLSDNHTGPNSHSQTNKDEATTPIGKLAKETATKHSEKIINEVITK